MAYPDIMFKSFSEGGLLEAMSKAVKNADAVLICVSKKYQESRNCKLGKWII